MAYATRAQIAAMVPASILARALDADGDGVEDSGRFDDILAVVQEEVDALLEPLYDVPLTGTIPASVADATRKLVCERLYQLNSTAAGDNPWTDPAADARERLGKIGAGEMPLSTATATPTGGVDDDDLDWATDNQDGL